MCVGGVMITLTHVCICHGEWESLHEIMLKFSNSKFHKYSTHRNIWKMHFMYIVWVWWILYVVICLRAKISAYYLFTHCLVCCYSVENNTDFWIFFEHFLKEKFRHVMKFIASKTLWYLINFILKMMCTNCKILSKYCTI